MRFSSNNLSKLPCYPIRKKDKFVKGSGLSSSPDTTSFRNGISIKLIKQAANCGSEEKHYYNTIIVRYALFGRVFIVKHRTQSWSTKNSTQLAADAGSTVNPSRTASDFITYIARKNVLWTAHLVHLLQHDLTLLN